MRALILSLALCALPAAAQTVGSAGRPTLELQVPQFDSRTASPAEREAAAKKVGALKPLEVQKARVIALNAPPVVGRSSTCLTMRNYQVTDERGMARLKNYTTCSPASNWREKAAAGAR